MDLILTEVPEFSELPPTQPMMQQAIQNLIKSFEAKKLKVIDYVLLHLYNITPSEEAYKRVSKVMFPDDDWEYYCLDYKDPMRVKGICFFKPLEHESDFTSYKVSYKLYYKAEIDIPEDIFK